MHSLTPDSQHAHAPVWVVEGLSHPPSRAHPAPLLSLAKALVRLSTK